MERKRHIIEVDNSFIEQWYTKYDEIEDDEEDYKTIITKVSN